ncbi:hypothetical protein GGI42DRAFT_326997 [Trichoderma sp. SZMC 28013]
MFVVLLGVHVLWMIMSLHLAMKLLMSLRVSEIRPSLLSIVRSTKLQTRGHLVFCFYICAWCLNDDLGYTRVLYSVKQGVILHQVV